MSVVRDILGVGPAKSSSSPVSALMSVMGAPPTVTKKRKSFLKEAREVASLRDSEGLIKSPPKTPEELENRKWKWNKFKNSAAFSKDIFLMSHWDYKQDEKDYPAARCNIKPEIPQLADVSSDVLSDVAGKYNLSTQDIETLFEILEWSEVNFIITADRFGDDLSVDQIKDIYYTVFSHVFPTKKCKYSHASDIERRKILQERQLSIATEGLEKVNELKRREKELVSDIKEIESQMKSLEADFAPIEKLITEGWRKEPQKKASAVICLASSEKKPPGYDLINKYLPGVVELQAFLSGKPAEVPQSTTQIVNKQSVDFSAFTKAYRYCTAFNSKEIIDFFAELNDIAEAEKTLTAFIKKREADIKKLKRGE